MGMKRGVADAERMGALKKETPQGALAMGITGQVPMAQAMAQVVMNAKKDAISKQSAKSDLGTTPKPKDRNGPRRRGFLPVQNRLLRRGYGSSESLG